jgi:hypothetical protein
MTQVFQLTTLYAGATGQQLQSVSASLNHLETSQPEGTQMQLVLAIAYPSNVVSHFESTSALNTQIAGALNRALLAKGVTPWPGASTIATASGTNQIIIRWRKESAQILAIVALLVGGIVALAV